jgi:hypothetical protein
MTVAEIPEWTKDWHLIRAADDTVSIILLDLCRISGVIRLQWSSHRRRIVDICLVIYGDCYDF